MAIDPPDVDVRDWLILDALSDDYESVDQIASLVRADWPSALPSEIIDRLERLSISGHVFLTLGATFKRAELLRESEQASASGFWFGRTPSGDLLWQQRATTFGYG